jgi:dTDP-4-dehydrorhamnose reductase
MILLTGSNGMVGSYFHEVKDTFDEELVFTDIDTLDIRDYHAVKKQISENDYTHVIHLAAETDVDLCEKDPDHAFKINVLGTQNVALACHEKDIIMVYISTAGVFGADGKAGPFTEFDPPNPANVYGITKLKGEEVVEKFLRKYFIVRAGWMIGGKEKDKKFVAKIKKLLETEKELKIVYDKIGSPTYAKELVIGIRELLKTDYYGLFHMTNKGTCSRYEIACEMAKILNTDIKITPVNSAHFPLPAPRAYSEAMRNMKLDLLGWNHMSHWKDALKEYLLSFDDK